MVPSIYGVKRLSELDNCLQQGLIKKVIPSKEKAAKSIGKAGKWLDEARRNREVGLFDSCVVSAYSAMFHAARSLLFRDGFREKSHYCLARYLEEKYVDTGKIERIVVDLLDRFRELRHEELYELDFSAMRQDANEAVKNAERVISAISKLLL
jgi:uncharacterized protein (UPF0332 family)